ncbi:MAG: FecR family protein [Cyclobacteriaceae bacterium]
MIEEKINKLIVSHLLGNIEPWEVKELMVWINSSPENKLNFQYLKNYWETSNQKVDIGEIELKSAVDKIVEASTKKESGQDQDALNERKLYPKKSRNFFRLKWGISVAASIVLIASVTYTFFISNRNNLVDNSNVFNESPVVKKTNPLGQKTNFKLPDGSMVWLNAGSELSYSFGSENKERIVNLTGEAFFDVSKDPNRPFIVKTEKFNVKALGTSFNIKSYKDHPQKTVALISGKVDVHVTANTDSHYFLNPGMGLKFGNSDNAPEDFNFSIVDVVAWKDGVLLFKENSFDEVKNTLEKWYGVNFTVVGRVPTDFIISGRYKNEYLKNVLTSLQFARPFRFEIEDKNVYINFN